MMTVYAAGESTAAAAGTAAGSQWSSLIIMVAIFAVFYFALLILPQKKQEKKQRAMIDAIKPGDEIITIGGIYGKVQTVKDDYVVIESTADKTKIKLLAKSSISKCLTEHDEPEAK